MSTRMRKSCVNTIGAERRANYRGLGVWIRNLDGLTLFRVINALLDHLSLVAHGARIETTCDGITKWPFVGKSTRNVGVIRSGWLELG